MKWWILIKTHCWWILQSVCPLSKESVSLCILFTSGMSPEAPWGQRAHLPDSWATGGALWRRTLEREHWGGPTSVPVFSHRAFFPCLKKKRRPLNCQQFEMLENWEFVMSLCYSKWGNPVFKHWDKRLHCFFLYLPNR